MKTFQRVIDLFKADLKNGETLRGLVRKTGLNSNTIANYLEGITEPTQSSLEKISKAYGKSVAWLRGDVDHDPPFTINGRALEPVPESTGKIPVVSMASANGDGPLWEDAYPVGHGMEMIHRPYDVTDPKAFGVKISGDSMSPKYDDGDVVVVCPDKQVVSGAPVVAKLKDGRVMVKRIRFLNGHVLLESVNPNYEPIFTTRDDIEFAYKVVWKKEV